MVVPSFSSKRGDVTDKHVLIGCKHDMFGSLKGVRARFTKMAERMDIKDFFEEIDPDLLKYASTFRKCGFSSSVTMKHWREQDFRNLGVEVPEGHRRLILNMETKIRTPKLKLGENRSFILLNYVFSDILGQRNAWFEVAAVFVYQKHTNKFENFQTLARKFA